MNIPFKFPFKEYAKKSNAAFNKKPIIIKIKIEVSELLNLINWKTPDINLFSIPTPISLVLVLKVEIKGNSIIMLKPSERPAKTDRKKTKYSFLPRYFWYIFKYFRISKRGLIKINLDKLVKN